MKHKSTAAPRKRSYRQYCALARALDLIGERWSLLIVRELLAGPRRYKDLLDNLQGIGTNLLADRLRMLVAEGIVAQAELPPPASTPGYLLTERGRELEAAVVALARWGLPLLGRPPGDDAYSGSWLLVAMKAVFDAEAAGDLDETYAYRIDGVEVHAWVHDGTVETGLGLGRDPAFVLTTDARTLRDIVAGDLRMSVALKTGRAELTGAADALARSARLFGLDAIHSYRAARKRAGAGRA